MFEIQRQIQIEILRQSRMNRYELGLQLCRLIEIQRLSQIEILRLNQMSI